MTEALQATSDKRRCGNNMFRLKCVVPVFLCFLCFFFSASSACFTEDTGRYQNFMHMPNGAAGRRTHGAPQLPHALELVDRGQVCAKTRRPAHAITVWSATAGSSQVGLHDELGAEPGAARQDGPLEVFDAVAEEPHQINLFFSKAF